MDEMWANLVAAFKRVANAPYQPSAPAEVVEHVAAQLDDTFGGQPTAPSALTGGAPVLADVIAAYQGMAESCGPPLAEIKLTRDQIDAISVYQMPVDDGPLPPFTSIMGTPIREVERVQDSTPWESGWGSQIEFATDQFAGDRWPPLRPPLHQRYLDVPMGHRGD